MSLSLSLARKLLKLMDGESIPSSSMKGAEADYLLAEGILATRVNKSRVSYILLNRSLLELYFSEVCGTADLSGWIEEMERKDLLRADLVTLTGNSKAKSVRTFKGFLLNSYDPVEGWLNGSPFVVLPREGTFLFLYDFEEFRIPDDVVIVGVENPENLRYITSQRSLFGDRKCLFVSRYPQSQSKDLLRWLLSLPNSYLHFGDIDLAGIHIYQTEFYAKLGNRAAFLIPSNIETFLKKGSRKRYDEQYRKYQNMKITDTRLNLLVELIHQYRRGYDQEGFIKEHFSGLL